MTANSAAGWSLIIAVVIGFFTSLLTPGGLLIDPADSASFGEAAGVLGDNSSLAQFLTFLFVVSVVLYWFGLHSLHRAFSGGSFMDGVSRCAEYLPGWVRLSHRRAEPPARTDPRACARRRRH